MRGVATQIEFCEGRAPDAAPGDRPERPYRRLIVHGTFIVLATEILESGERPVASGLLPEEPATLLASLVRAARWEGLQPGAGRGDQLATVTFDDAPDETVALRCERREGEGGLVERDGLDGLAGKLVEALGTLLDAAFARGTKGILAWRPPSLDGPRDTMPSPPPTSEP
jgi:hypothetical protein